MEIKIRNSNTIGYEHNSIKTIRDNCNATFSESLHQVVTKSTSTLPSSKEIDELQNNNKTTGIPKIDNLSEQKKDIVFKSIKTLNDMFDINILQNKDEFFNEDSQIKIRDILDGYGDHITSNDLNSLSSTINRLLDTGMISNEDYYYAIKWMALKREQFNVKLKIENTKSIANNLMWNPKKSATENLNTLD